jgi:hypothetical protein
MVHYGKELTNSHHSKWNIEKLECWVLHPQ